MTSTLQLGSLALPLTPLLLAGAATIGLTVGKRLGRIAGVDPEPLLLRMFLLGLLCARLAFIWEWRGLYLSDPIAIVDIRDGGWEPVAGVVAACLYGISRLPRQIMLRRPVLGALATTLVLWAAGHVALLAWPTGSRESLPEFSLPMLDGRLTSLSAFKGKPVVINLWATWCPPCRREMPLLQRAQAANVNVAFVFVDQGETRDAVVRYLEAQGMTLQNVLLDKHKASGAAFNEQALPTTLFFDANGHLVSTRIGALSEATLAQRIDALRPGADTAQGGQAASK